MRGLSADRAFVAAYGFAHFGKSLFWQSGEILFVFFLTEICAIPPLQTGILLGGALLFSGFADLAVARYLGRWMTTPAHAARLQLIGTVICALALLQFAWTTAIPPEGRFAFALTASLLFRLAYALIDVPQNAILGLATRDDAERIRLSSTRFIVGGAAAICISGLVALLIVAARATDPVANIVLPVVAMGAVAIAGAMLNLSVARRRPGRESTSGTTLDFRASIVIHPVGWLILMAVATSATAPVFSKLEPYFAAYAIGSAAAGGFIVAATSLGGVLTQPLWTALAYRLSRRRVIEVAAATLIVGSVAFLGLGAHGMIWAVTCGFIFGAGLGGLGMAIWASLGDASARATPSGAAPSAAAIFAAFTFASKVALSVSIVLVSVMLTTHLYRTPAVGEVWVLAPFMCLLPASGAMICLLMARFLTGATSSALHGPSPRVQPSAQ